MQQDQKKSWSDPAPKPAGSPSKIKIYETLQNYLHDLPLWRTECKWMKFDDLIILFIHSFELSMCSVAALSL